MRDRQPETTQMTLPNQRREQQPYWVSNGPTTCCTSRSAVGSSTAERAGMKRLFLPHPQYLVCAPKLAWVSYTQIVCVFCSDCCCLTLHFFFGVVIVVSWSLLEHLVTVSDANFLQVSGKNETSIP